MKQLSIIFWNNSAEMSLKQALPADIAESIIVYETRDFHEAMKLLSERTEIEMVLTTLYPTDIQALYHIQQLQQSHPEIALLAIVDTMLRLPAIIQLLRRLMGKFDAKAQAELANQQIAADRMTDDTEIQPLHPYAPQPGYPQQYPGMAFQPYMGHANYLPHNAAVHQYGYHNPYTHYPYQGMPPQYQPPQQPYYNQQWQNQVHQTPNSNGTMLRLTPRQLDVLYLIMNGKSNKEIARMLDLSEGTVKIHCMAVFKQLGVNNRTQAAMRAEQMLPQLQALQEEYKMAGQQSDKGLEFAHIHEHL